MAEDLLDRTDAILITGPTASGKSALALDLAERHDGVILNADSMQVYDALPILTARPGTDDLARAEHRLYGHVAAERTYSTGAWLSDISAEIAALRQAGRLPIIVGGTGLYFKALSGGLSDLPAIPAEIRERLRAELKDAGPEALHRRLGTVDPASAGRIGITDGQRIVRALEVHEATGTPLSVLASRPGAAILDFRRCDKRIVLPDRAVLAERINRRFSMMMAGGAVDEVRALLDRQIAPDRPVMKAIGVREIAAMLTGELTREAAIDRASAATRQYAKRQMTWFRNQMGDDWRIV